MTFIRILEKYDLFFSSSYKKIRKPTGTKQPIGAVSVNNSSVSNSS